MTKKIWGWLRQTDLLLLAFCLSASLYGMVTLYSIGTVFEGSQRLAKVQLIATLLGVAVALAVSFIDYHLLAALWKVIAPIALILVGLTFVIGLQAQGADDRAWLPLPFGLTFQPSELLKIAFILTFSVHLNKVKEEINRPLQLLLLCLHGAFPCLLIHFQGDDGTALVFAFIFVVMLFAAGLSWKYLLAALLVSPIAGVIAWFYLLNDMQRTRFLLVFNPELDPLGAGYQPLQGKITLGSGMLSGRGLFSDELRSVPAMQNDFVFAYIGQVFGFLGCVLVVVLFVAIALRALAVARGSSDFLGYLIATGVFAIFVFQAVINMGMSLSLTPVIGITLPFFSSGGSSVVITYLSVGLVFSVFRHRQKDMFETLG